MINPLRNADLELKAPAMLGGGKVLLSLRRDGDLITVTLKAPVIGDHSTQVSVATVREFAEKILRICNG